jgi:predicted alpha/beta superfamily hydrolase
MPRAAWVVCAGLLPVATRAFPDAAYVQVTFQITTNTTAGHSVFVVGSIPQLYNWEVTRAVKLVPSNCIGSNCNWSVRIGIPPGVSYQYKFITRADCAACYSNPTNVSWEPGANRTGSTPPGQPSPYTGKTVFYYSAWSSVSLLYSNPVVGFTNKAMSAVGPGRTNLFPGEKVWRADGINTAGDPNLHCGFYTVVTGTNVYDGGGVSGVDYQTPLDAFVVQDGQVYNYWPPPFVSTNRVDRFTIVPTNGLVSRTVYVYVPRGYNENTTKRYPVLYMQDGQNLFLGMTNWITGYGWGADTTASNLIRFGQMRETIIVGVSSDPERTSQRRLCEYSPPQPGCTNFCSSPLGSQYTSLLLNMIKPRIDASYRTLTNADDTGVMGASMGGLISIYLAWAYTNTFHKFGAMSAPDCDSDCSPIRAEDAARPKLRIYLDSGDTNGPGNTCLVNDSLLSTMGKRDMLLNKGYVLNVNLDHTIGLHQPHSELWWAARLPRPFTFLFPTSDEPDTVLDSAAPFRITNLQLMGTSNVVTWSAYKAREYSLEGSLHQSFSSSMNWSNLFTTPTPESLPWNYISAPATNTFNFFRVRELAVPNWPN